MTVTVGPRFGLTRWSSGTDPLRRSQLDASHAALEQYAMRGEEVPTLADRPAAGIRDRYVTVTATDVTYRDNGTTWAVVGASTAGKVRHAATTGQTGTLLELTSAEGAVATFDVEGRLTAATSTLRGRPDATTLHVEAVPSVGTPPPVARFRGPSGNNADLLRAENNVGEAVASIGPTGRIAAAALSLAGPDGSASPLTVNGATGQNAPLTRWRDSTGAVLASISPAGGIESRSSAILSAHGATIAQLVRAATAQGASIAEWQSSAGAALVKITSDGNLEGRQITSSSPSSTTPALIAQSAAAHSGNVLEVRNSADVVLAAIDHAGHLTRAGIRYVSADQRDAINGVAALDSSRKLSSFVLPTHGHAASDISSGILPVVRGGTGGATWQAAHSALNITPAAIGARPDGGLVPANDVTISSAVRLGAVVQTIGAVRTRFLSQSGNFDAGHIEIGGERQADGELGGIKIHPGNYGGLGGGRIQLVHTYGVSISGRTVGIDSNGYLGYVSSTRRHKSDVTPLEGAPRILDVDAVTYHHDLNPDPDSREVGVIAEQVAELGLDELVLRDEDGDPTGVAYDRLAVYLIPLIRDLRDRVTALERAAR